MALARDCRGEPSQIRCDEIDEEPHELLIEFGPSR
jgi:hypothetical protein